METMPMSFFTKTLVACLLLSVAASTGWSDPPKKPPQREFLPPTLSWLRNVEAAQMLGAIVSGTPPSSGEMGWFHPGQGKYSLKWLLERMDKDGDGAISKEEFTGPASLFERLDRDHDGRLTAKDFDWSDQSPLNRQMQIVNPFFQRVNTNQNEKLTEAEWLAAFKKASKGKDSLSREELHALLFPPPPPPSKNPGGGMPSPLTLIGGLFSGEIGSFHEGPSLGQLAPNFTLQTAERDTTIRLSQFRGKKPVVLVFGSFT
jgi:hypothetical protein